MSSFFVLYEEKWMWANTRENSEQTEFEGRVIVPSKQFTFEEEAKLEDSYLSFVTWREVCW